MFKRSLFFYFLFFNFLFFNSTVLASTKIESVETGKEEAVFQKLDRPKYAPGEVLVKFKEGQVNLSNPGLLSFLREYGIRITNNLEKDNVIESGNIIVYKINDDRSVEEVINEIKTDPNIETVEPNYYSYPSDLGTDDVDKNNLWGLDNFGQTITFDNGTTTVGTSGVDIDLVRAWNVSVGTSEIIVAVIDTGVAWNHTDLIDNMWDGTNCLDQNGESIVGGCFHGYNFVIGSTNPTPTTTGSESSHGTHVAGTIAGVVNNSLGIAGVGQKTKIMALNCATEGGSLSGSCIINSIDFAIKNGAKIINASYAGPSYSSLEYDAINRFKTAGGVFVAAAGNDAVSNETAHSYPSDYDLDNIISVAATDNNDQLASFSNYGSSSVDVGAPGVDIYSTVNYRKDYFENFLNLTADVGSSWLIANSSTKGKIMWGSGNTPYLHNSNYTITSNTIDLSNVINNPTEFNFKAACDDAGTTNPDNSAASDYMSLEISSDGTNFVEVSKWNELSISQMSDDACGSTFCGNSFNIDIGSSYLTSNFKYRFRWVTDDSLNTNNGCYVYEIKIIDYSENGVGAGYDYKNGTSMAAPHVSGLAGYLLSVNPLVTYSQLVDIILTNGDSIDALSGKTTTGKRINVYNSVLALEALETPSPTETPTPTVTPYPTPSAPSNLVVVPGDSQVLLSWTGPTDVGSTILQYQIGYKISEVGTTEFSWTTQIVDDPNINYVTVSDLTNGTSYDFRVAAVNQNGLGLYAYTEGIIPIGSTTPTETPTPTVTPYPTPSAPSDIVTIPGDSQILLSWIGPTDVGSTILQYQIGYKISEVGTTEFSWTTQIVETSEHYCYRYTDYWFD